MFPQRCLKLQDICGARLEEQPCVMNKHHLHRQVLGSALVDNPGKFRTLAGLLQEQPEELKLDTLFSTRSSGWTDAAAFHAACDNKGPTLVLIQCSDGTSYGGYNSVSWKSTKGFQEDAKAVLFRIPGFGTSQTQQTPERFARTRKGNDVYCAATYGPTFGAGHDLLTFHNASQQLSCQPSSYNTGGPLISTTVPKDATNYQMEVLQVSTSPASFAEEMDAPWITGCGWSPEEACTMQKAIFGFNPASEGSPIKTLNILLCGGVGAGKSSIVSTVDSLYQGRSSRIAPHGQGTGSFTRKLHKYKFTDPDTKRAVHWQLWDSMGWGTNDYKSGELGFILDGHLPNKCQLDKAISLKTEGFKLAPSIKDTVHCMCLVVPCESATDDSYMQRLNEMREVARGKGIPILVFLTKIDKYDPDVIGEDLTKTFHSARLLSLMEDLEDRSGVGGCKDILPIKNLSKEITPTPEASVLVCRALQQALYAAVDYLRGRDDMETSEEDSEL